MERFCSSPPNVGDSREFWWWKCPYRSIMNMSCEFHVALRSPPWDGSRWRLRKLRFVAASTGYLLVRHSRWKRNGKMENRSSATEFHQFISRAPRTSLQDRKQKHTSLVWNKLIWKSQGSAFWVCCKLHMYSGLKCQTSPSNQVAFDAVVIGLGIRLFWAHIIVSQIWGQRAWVRISVACSERCCRKFRTFSPIKPLAIQF